ncbi:MAG: hypothetical protein IIX72_04575 [Oscillospiraceae bacterium]|nr:hypothetical protein [Oscillospiraceae bacterium]
MSDKSFLRWLDGEQGYSLNTDLRDNKVKTKAAKSKKDEKAQLTKFNKIYASAAVMISVLMVIILCVSIISFPTFGSVTNPTNNEVVERYVGSAHHETGAENVIAGMILNYRGFDTFGESCVLFLAVCSVMQLLWATDDKIKAEGEKSKREAKSDLILSTCGKLIIPFVLVFGVCILFNGHISPGGGFSGGSVLGASVILFAVTYGSKATSRFFTKTVFNIIRISGLMVYAIMFGVYIYQGANGIESDLAHYIVLVIDLAVGLVVMSTMYGFYSFYTKGDL